MQMIRYPEGTILPLLQSDRVTIATREVLLERLATETRQPPRTAGDGAEAAGGAETAGGAADSGPRFFSPEEAMTLSAVCDRLIPQRDCGAIVEIAGAIDRRLARVEGNGWRYDALPPDGEAYCAGLRALDASAVSAFGSPFHALGPLDQAAMLTAVQLGQADPGAWSGILSARFFEELLAEACEIYYSHPLAQEEIGYVGMADAHGWTDIGLNQRAPHEPAPIEERP